MANNSSTGTLLLAELMKRANEKNLNGQPVIRHIEDKFAGSTTYVRHDAMVYELNKLLKASTASVAVEMCGHDSCPDDGRCEHCKKPVYRFERPVEGGTEGTGTACAACAGTGVIGNGPTSFNPQPCPHCKPHKI